MKNDLISIIVPIYNVEKYLVKCIDSLVNQTYKNIEIILVDDGATDNSGKMADEISKKDKRIIVYHKKNGGLSDARNYGIEKAKGKYICFVDSDDFVNKDYIYTLYDLIIKSKCQISVIGYEKIYNYEDIADDECEGIIKKYTTEEAIDELFKEDSYGNYAWNKMYNINLFNDIRYPFGKKMEDLGTTYKLFLKCDRIIYNNKKLYYYYQRDGSIINTHDSKLYLDLLTQAIERYKTLKIKYSNSELNKIYIVEAILNFIPLIDYNKEIIKECENIIRTEVNNKLRKKLSYKKVIKAFIFKLNKDLFIKIFKKNKK